MMKIMMPGGMGLGTIFVTTTQISYHVIMDYLTVVIILV